MLPNNLIDCKEWAARSDKMKLAPFPFFCKPDYKNTELEAIKVGRYLSEQFREVPKISRDLPTGFVEIASQAISDFGLMKIKVFAPDGEIVFSFFAC